ncbi:hypothetical protein [Comamonas sp. MYb396]|uniref:hypothetical protein n=1 Tax=Comamonas sp. MYb396 TaxID=2745302 RepID=UPI0030B65455
MSVQISSIEPSVLHKKVSDVGASAGGLNLVLAIEKNDSIQDFSYKYQELRNLISGFESINSISTLNHNALVMADNIADLGLEMATILSRSQLFSGPRFKEIASLAELSNDLKSYCGSGARLPNSAGYRIRNGFIASEGNEGDDESRLARLRAQIEDMDRSFIAMDARLKAMSESSDRAVARIEELTGQQADAMRAALTREVSKLQEEFNNTNDALKKRLEEFDGYKDQAIELVGQLASEVLSKGHIGSAQTEEKSADRHRIAAMVSMAAAIIIIGLMFYFYRNQPFTWESSANKVLIALLFAVPTAFLARESAKHRAQAIELRRTSLDFAALDPFLKGLEGEEGLKVRAELARRAFFAGSPADSSSSYGVDLQPVLVKLVDTLADVAKKKT